MKISLISIPLACAVITSCQYRPKNFYANKSQEPSAPIYSSPNYTTTPDYNVPSYQSGNGGNINYVHRQGGTSGTWNSSIGNFALNNGSTFEVGRDQNKIKIVADLNNLEIIELRLTNVYGGRDYHVDVKKVMSGGGLNMKIDKGTYRIDVRNRWETHADPAPSGVLTVEW